MALSAAREAGTSAALFAPGWVYEEHHKSTFEARQELFWSKVRTSLAVDRCCKGDPWPSLCVCVALYMRACVCACVHVCLICTSKRTNCMPDRHYMPLNRSAACGSLAPQRCLLRCRW